MTDLERVRRDLIRRGIEGTSQDRFDPPYTADGGPPIPQIARRIRDLRAKGDAITTIKGVGYCRYVYTKYLSSGAGGVVVESPGAVEQRPPAAQAPVSGDSTSAPPASLFDVAESREPRSAIYDEEAA